MAERFDAEAAVRDLVERADERMKAASNRSDPAVAHDAAKELLERAERVAAAIPDVELREALCLQVVRRLDDVRLLEARGPASATHPTTDVDGTDQDAPDDTPSLPQPGPQTLATAQRTGGDRLPPNQRLLTTFPVLHVGRVPPSQDLEDVRLVCRGAIGGRRRVLGIDDLRALPEVEVRADFHCVTGWSRFDNAWTGVGLRDLFEVLDVDDVATHVLTYGANAYSANLDLETMVRDDGLLAWAHDGQLLEPEHGGPLRTIVPSRYGWKSVKWVEGFQFLDHDVPGYWEARGYHNVADPFLEQRYA